MSLHNIDAARSTPLSALIGIGLATAAAHIGNNFTTYLIGGLIDRYGFSPVQMGAWSMAETLAYATAMFVIAPRVARLSPRLLLMTAGVMVCAAQLSSAGLANYTGLFLGRLAAGCGFGLANSALNLAAGRTASPVRAISVGIVVQTLIYAFVSVGLPMIGERVGLDGMFTALAVVSAVFTLGAVWLPSGPARASAPVVTSARVSVRIDGDGRRVLLAMALFTFGSLAIWQFMERAAHAIGLSAVTYGRYQSAATVASALGNLVLAVIGSRAKRTPPLMVALLVCGCACGALTTVSQGPAFGFALIVFNVSWFITYPLLLGIAYAVEPGGRLAVLCSAVWLLMMSLGSLATGFTAQFLGGYDAVGPMGLLICLTAGAVIWPLARRLDRGAERPMPDEAVLTRD